MVYYGTDKQLEKTLYPQVMKRNNSYTYLFTLLFKGIRKGFLFFLGGGGI